MATGWLRGIVKEVPSGDTLVIAGVVKPGVMPPEKRITLSSLIAPKLGRRDGTTLDEPFAWSAKEFLRKKAVGQSCVFRVDYTLEQVAGREFGSVFIGDQKENVAISVVAAGWAKVRQGGGQQSPFYEDLARAEEEAKTTGLGLWSTDPKALEAAVRPSYDGNTDPQELLGKHGKGKPLPAIVEMVLNGSTMRVTLLDDFSPATVFVCGVQCPSMGRRAAPAASAAAAPAAGGAADFASAAAAEAPGGTTQPDPYACEAKLFTETRVLNREVRVVLAGVDKFGNLFGEVKYPDADTAVDLGQALVKEGLAKTVEWGLNMMPSGSFTLREMERKAKQAKVALWTNYTPPVSAGTERSAQFSGVVVEVVSGDCMVVKDAANGKEHRLMLSSIRTPRLGRRDDKPEAWAVEGKELLRTRCIGKPVEVSIEYTRKVGATPGGGDAPAGASSEMTFATIMLKEENMAVALLSAGLASTVKHRSDDARSAHFLALIEAEEEARKGRKGMHSGREPPSHRINDVSLQGSANRARGLLPFLQRQGRMSGVCEFVMNGHRLRVFIPKESTVIAFSPSGVRTPQRGGGGYGGTAAAEPFGDEAFAFTRQHVLQREVEIEVDTVDKAGTFLGTLRIPNPRGGAGGLVSLGAELLSAGLAKLHPSFDAARVKEGAALAEAQAEARAAKRRVWENESDVEASELAASASASNGAPFQRKKMEVVVTEVVDGHAFFMQDGAEPRVEWLVKQLAGLGLEDVAPAKELREGSMCIAKYTVDGQWYRAVVERASRGAGVEYDVQFVDYGNSERVPASAVRPTDAAVAAVAPLAIPAGLAFLKVPSLSDDYGADAANFLCDALGGGKAVTAWVEAIEPLTTKPKNAVLPRTRQLVTLTRGDGGATVNEQMVAEGLARVQEPKGQQPPEVAALLSKLKEAEAGARRKHVGVWQYGDAGSDDDEPAPSAWGRNRRRA